MLEKGTLGALLELVVDVELDVLVVELLVVLLLLPHAARPMTSPHATARVRNKRFGVILVVSSSESSPRVGGLYTPLLPRHAGTATGQTGLTFDHKIGRRDKRYGCALHTALTQPCVT
jgi:hypothetical protein